MAPAIPRKERDQMKVLLLTVGGSCEPLVESILKNNPDKIYFICSGGEKSSRRIVIGEGHVCGKDLKNPDKPNILIQVNINPSKKEKFKIMEIDDFDNPNSCYEACAHLISTIRREYPSAEIIADYTGGTKSMTAGLIMAAMNDPGVTLCVITGKRKDLIRVASGTQQKRLIGVKLPFLERQFQAAVALADRYDYAGCLQILETLLDTPDIPSEMHQKILKAVSLARGFREWDRFNHRRALEILESYAGEITDNFLFLKRIVRSRAKLDEKFEKFCADQHFSIAYHGYELVEDLLLNAERKAFQGFYDDATGRVYRALEVLVDARLQIGYGINKNNLDLSKLEKTLTCEHKQGEKLGLKEGFDLLVEINRDDELALEYVKSKKKIDNSLSNRNNSFFAHGYAPISKKEFESFLGIVEDLYESFIGRVFQSLSQPIQFPHFSDIFF